MSDLFVRVRPLVGEVLERCEILVAGAPAAGSLVDYFAACGVRRWVVMAKDAWMGEAVARVRVRYGDEVACALRVVDSVDAVNEVDVALVVDDAALARTLPITLARLAIFTPTGEKPCCVILALPGETFVFPDLVATNVVRHPPSSKLQASRKVSTAKGSEGESWDWLTAAPLVALAARSLLLQGTPFAMATWENAWARGVRSYCVGGADDPTRAAWDVPLVAKDTGYRTPLMRRGTLLVVGLGSLGSVAAQVLAPWVEQLVLVDADVVEVPNLVRQAYSQGQLGEAKAVALANALQAAHSGLVCVPVVAALTGEEAVRELIEAHAVTAALVTTGTHADFAVTRALRVAAVPHVAGRCYARARFWEGIVVDGAAGPSYEQVRRQVAVGPTPAPTPEEIAAYGAVGELVGEPATAMECGWAAMWLARLTAQISMPAALRERWLLARLGAGATCFVGGLVVEPSVEQEGMAYGVAVPGEVHAWTVEELD